MTATALAPSSTPTHIGRVSFPHLLRSEWIKLRSLRSTVWSYATMVVLSIGMAALMSASLSFGAELPPAEMHSQFFVQASTFGVFFGQMIVAVLGVLVMSGEYSTGMIRSTLTAAPGRLSALWAKATVLFLASFVVGLVSVFGAFAVAAPILSSNGLELNLGDSNILLSLLGASLYLAVVSVFGLGLGTIIRSSAGGITAALGLILLLPIVLIIPPIQWMHDLVPYTLMNAGFATFGLNVFGGPSPLETWGQFLTIALWAVAVLILGAVLLKRRDA